MKLKEQLLNALLNLSPFEINIHKNNDKNYYIDFQSSNNIVLMEIYESILNEQLSFDGNKAVTSFQKIDNFSDGTYLYGIILNYD